METLRYQPEPFVYDPETTPAGRALHDDRLRVYDIHTGDTYPVMETIRYQDAVGSTETQDARRDGGRYVRALGGTASKLVAAGGNEVGDTITGVLVSLAPGADVQAAEHIALSRRQNAAVHAGNYALAFN